MWLLMKQCPLKHKECPLKRQVVDRVVHSPEIQVAKATNRQKNSSAEESIPGEPAYMPRKYLSVAQFRYIYICYHKRYVEVATN